MACERWQQAAQGIEKADVEFLHGHPQRVGAVRRKDAVYQQDFVVVAGHEPFYGEVFAAVTDFTAGDAPAVAFVVNVGRQGAGAHRETVLVPVQVSGKVELGMGALLVFVVEGVTKAHLVVVGKQGNAVVQDLCAGKGDLLAGERGCLHGVAVVKVQLQVFDEFVVVGNAPGFYLRGDQARFVHIQGQAGVFLQIQAGHQEIPQQLRAFYVHLQLVRGAFPRLRRFFQQGGDIPVNDQVGEVIEEAGRGGIAHVGAIQEAGFQADAAHIVVGMGLHHNVAQFVPAGFAFQPDVA